MSEIIRLFSDPSLLDELGLAAVRDSFSDLLFPGISTIHTRPAYLLFVPWLYQQIERNKVPSANAREQVRAAQARLVDALLKSDDTEGVIGSQSGASLRRTPDEIYWHGLGIFRIRRNSSDRATYFRSLDRHYRAVQAGAEVEPNWDPTLPDAPKGFPTNATLALTFEHADYLRSRVAAEVPHSLLAALVTYPVDLDPNGAPWDVAGLGLNAPTDRYVQHARYFSESMHGAQLLYNLMLAERRLAKGSHDGDDELCERYRARLATFIDTWQQSADGYRKLDRMAFWATVAETDHVVTPHTRLFIDRWLDLVASAGANVTDNDDARRLVEDRERSLKRTGSRFGSSRQLEIWSGASGSEPMRFRWRQAVAAHRDIMAGLRGPLAPTTEAASV